MPIFVIKNEGDCERVAGVFVEWLEQDSPYLKVGARMRCPNAQWAYIFSSIYADTVFNNALENKAELNIIELVFEPMDDDGMEFSPSEVESMMEELNKMSDEDLNDLIDEFLEDEDEEGEEDA